MERRDRDEIWETVSQKERRQNRKVKRREESFYQSQDVMTMLVFYCHKLPQTLL